jgi:lipoate-protein ligase A
MKFFEYSNPDPAHLLACDHALLNEREENGDDDVLMFWESSSPFVVLGYTDRVRTAVNVEECARENVPILRRCSGGGTVVQGRGCLNYSLVLRIPTEGALSNLSQTNQFVMNRMRQALQTLTQQSIEVRGITDLAVDGLKFSGNAQRRRRNFLLFHGTVLYDFDLDLLGRLLQMPTRQPDYRSDRSHRDFVTNLRLSPDAIKEALCAAWSANRVLEGVPTERIEQLVRDVYSQDGWNFKL